MDLSNAFDCIPHDFLMAKMEAYGFSEGFLTFLYSYLKRWKQSVNINNVHRMFQILLSGVPQGSVLGLLLFNILMNDLFYFIKETQLLNFTDDITIGTFLNSVDDLITDLQKEYENAIDWFRSNKMVINLDKFQSIIINRLGKLKDSYELLIDNHKIDLENFVKLLGIEIDNKLNFEKHVTTLCQKDGPQLNVLSRIHKYIWFQDMKMLLDSFIFSYFNHCPLVWHFCSAALSQKIEKIQERALRLLYNDSYSSYNS